jgi:hypothetical protein
MMGSRVRPLFLLVNTNAQYILGHAVVSGGGGTGDVALLLGWTFPHLLFFGLLLMVLLMMFLLKVLPEPETSYLVSMAYSIS